MDIKDVVYSAINAIGMEKIRADVASDIKSSEKYCLEIITMCASNLDHGASDESLATLCEALLHFMLTASLLPSERRVRMHDAELDIVVPSRRGLGKSPDKSLVIQVIRDDLATRSKQAESVQPNRENIWLVSTRSLQTNYRNYHLSSESSYPRIISDIGAFLDEKGDRGLRLLP